MTEYMNCGNGVIIGVKLVDTILIVQAHCETIVILDRFFYKNCMFSELRIPVIIISAHIQKSRQHLKDQALVYKSGVFTQSTNQNAVYLLWLVQCELWI